MNPRPLVADARRHGVTIRQPCINASQAGATLEPVHPDTPPRQPAPLPETGTPPQLDHAIGLGSVRGIGDPLAERIVDERHSNGPYRDMADLTARIALTTAHVEALATAGAFHTFDLARREALWAAGAIAQNRPDRLPVATDTPAPELPDMTALETAAADVWATGISPTSYPTQYIRDHLTDIGALPINQLAGVEPGTRITVGGVVTHRQRPATAGGVTFLNLEDETGTLNVICSPGLYTRAKRVIRASPALLIRGQLERAEGVTSLLADKMTPLSLKVQTTWQSPESVET